MGYDSSRTAGGEHPVADRPLAEQIAAMRAVLPGAGLDGLLDEDRLAALHELELLTRSVAALGAHLQVAFHAHQVASQIQDGVAPSRAGRGVGDDLALARMTSPYWGSRDLTCAKALVTQMPHTLQALADGVISGLQARVLTEATTCLEPADRAEVDRRLSPQLAGASTREIGALARGLVYEVDPAGFVARARKAAAERGVSCRPCPDVMGLVSARLPAAQAIACYQALRRSAEAMKSSGDPRTLQQLMADEFYARITGRVVVDGIDVEVGLVITDTALFQGTSDPATLIGYGPVPAQTARDLLNPATDGEEISAEETGAEEQMEDDEDDEVDKADDNDEDDDTDKIVGNGQDDATSDPGDPVQDTSDEDTTMRAREDSERNAAGFVGGVVPEGHCPNGPRCTDFSCILTHGHPAAGAMPAAPDLSSLSGKHTTPTGPDTPGGESSSEDARSDSTLRGDDPADHPGEDSAHPRGARVRDPAPADPCQSAAGRAATVWVRRLYADPVTGVLVARDPRRRLFTGSLRAFLVARDQTCRNAWCGAPIRAIDHIQRHADDGTTDASNGQGLCARCNLSRERPRHLDPQPDTYRPAPPLLPVFPRPASTQGQAA